MPSVAELKSKNARAVHEKHLDLISKYTNHRSSVESLHIRAKTEILDSVTEQLDLNEEGKARVLAYLSDFSNLFRFFRRSRYDEEQALSLLTATVLWRMRTDLDLLSLASLNPLYVTPPPPNPPLFWVNSNFRDFYGRPCGIINLRSVERTAENTLDQLKEYIVACMEMMRRYVGDLYRESVSKRDGTDEETVLQASIAVDLASSGMANLELELLPFLLDLLKNHVPGMVGAVYVLNYGWVHAGMWAVIKRVLPQQALAKIFFPSHEELKEHFDVKNIPKCYGGELEVDVEASSNDVLRKYGRPRRASSAAAARGGEGATPPMSPKLTHMSRTNSYDSIYEVFYSADSTPWASRSMTPRHSEPSTPRGDQSNAGAGTGLKMTPSAARKLRHLQMSRGDLSSAAEHGYARTGRARSASDPRVSIVDGRAVGLSVSTGASPFVTPAMTPVGPLSPRISRRTDRHVRFSTKEDQQSRVGANSNFKLYLPEDDEEAILPSESEDSDASGKDGELLTPPNPNEGGFLNRLRRLSETRFTGTSKDKTSDLEQKEQEAEGTIMYIDPTPSSPHLQVPHLDEPPLQQHIPHTFLSHRTRRSARDGLVSPYNANNPFFGYPAYNPATSTSHPQATFRLSRSATPQHLHSRRRKRDLLRTLTYLFVLRILAFHRRLRWRFALVWREMAKTFSVGANANAGGEEGEEFWRNLDARRLSAEEKRERNESGEGKEGVLGRVGKKFLGAMVLVMLLRPEWRQRTVLRVYNMVTTMRGDREERGEVDWEEWEKRGLKCTQGSWTGLHLRKRFGVKAVAAEDIPVKNAAAGNGKGKSKATNPIAIAGGLVSAAGLAYLLYNYLSSPNDSKGDDEGVSRRRTSLKPPTSTPSRNRPSLSLTLSPSFTRDSTSISGLRSLLTTLSPLFVIHLILPGSESTDLSTSISSLITTLSTPTPIPDFDTRRILEYTQSSGRFALSRALACDCHVEVSLPGSSEQGTVIELGKIRRSFGLVVFASFERESVVLAELKREAGGNRDAPEGMRAFDLSQVSDGWVELGVRLKGLRDGWK